MHALLSSFSTIGVDTFSPIFRRNRNQKASCAAVAAAIHSASIVLSATVDCDLDYQLIRPPASNKHIQKWNVAHPHSLLSEGTSTSLGLFEEKYVVGSGMLFMSLDETSALTAE